MNKNRVYNIRIFVIYLALRAWRRWGEAEKKKMEKIVKKPSKYRSLELWEKIKLLYEIFFYLSFQQNWCSLNRWLDWPNLTKNNYTHMIICTIFKKKKNFSLIFTLFFIAVIWWGVRFGRWRHRIISWTFDLFNSWKM